MSDKVLLDYGSGGKASQRLIGELFLKNFDNPELRRMNDGAVLNVSGKIAVSTDTFTVDPIFFPGGDIGALPVGCAVWRRCRRPSASQFWKP